jgi:Polysaccharide lyase
MAALIRWRSTVPLLAIMASAVALPAIAATQSSDGGTSSAAPERTVTDHARAGSRATRGTVTWRADGEQPLNRQWAEYSTATHCGVTSDHVTSDPQAFRESSVVAQGSYAYEFVVSPADDNKCYGGARAEIGQGLPEEAGFSMSRRFNQGEDLWFSFQVLLGSDFPVSNPNWDVIAQWKQDASTAPVPGPMLALQVYSGHLWLVAAGGTANPNWSDYKMWRLARVKVDRWIKITMHIKFDTDPRLGFVEIYGQPRRTGMRRLLSRRHLSTLATDGNGNWVPSNARIGIYRSAAISGMARLFYDGYTVATSRSAAQGNAFRRSQRRPRRLS